MFLNIFRTLTVCFLLFSFAAAEETISFLVPDGWELKNNTGKLIFTPEYQSSPAEILEITTENTTQSPSAVLKTKTDKLANIYDDLAFYNVDKDSTMALGCTLKGKFCKVIRCFRGQHSIIVLNYTNFKPHYSQSFFQKWTNILSNINTDRYHIKKEELFKL